MAEPLHAVPAQNHSLKQNQIVIVGRLDRCSKFDNKFDHILTIPAADEFSMPSLVRLNASSKLADIGEMVKCLATYRGMPNTFTLQEGVRAGEKVYDVRGWFVAVE